MRSCVPAGGSLRPSAVASLLLCLAVLIGAPGEASAQSFLEKLFGGWGGSSAAPQPAPPPVRMIYAPEQQAPNPWTIRRDSEGDNGSKHGGTYRTLCVRMCDGYYWPISHATTRPRFYKDASACRASCGQEAQLFYHPTGGDQSDMVDITGRAYAHLPTAFKYRKTLVAGCKCRPEPWAVSEIERHQGYAAADAADTETAKAAAPAAQAEAKGGAPAPAAGGGGAASPDAGGAAGVVAAALPPPRPRLARTEARPRPTAQASGHQPPMPAPARPSGSGWPFGAGAKGLVWPGD